jgi:hypothetical protein
MLRMSADLLLPWVGRGNAPVDVQDVARAFAGAHLRGEVGDRLGDVGGQDADAQRRALAIEVFELLRRNAVRAEPIRARDERSKDRCAGARKATSTRRITSCRSWEPTWR